MACNCMADVREKLKSATGADVVMPVGILSGRPYLTATKYVECKGKQKRENVNILLSRCPFCGVEYAQKEAGSGE